MAHCPFCLWEEANLSLFDDIEPCDEHRELYEEALEFLKEWPI